MIKRVLIVDDNFDNAELLSHIVLSTGAQPLIAYNGKEAIEKARQENPDLIFMDIQMPIMDGYEATQILKSAIETKDIKIVALSAHISGADQPSLQKKGFAAYFTKPLNINLIKNFLNPGNELISY